MVYNTIKVVVRVIEILFTCNKLCIGLYYLIQDTIFSTAMEKLDFAKNTQLPDYGLFERSDDWSSCTYFYLDNTMNMLPKIDSVERRI